MEKTRQFDPVYVNNYKDFESELESVHFLTKLPSLDHFAFHTFIEMCDKDILLNSFLKLVRINSLLLELDIILAASDKFLNSIISITNLPINFSYNIIKQAQRN